MEYLFDGLAFIVLLIFSAFFSGSEAAIFHLPRVTVERLAIRFPIIKEKEKLLSTVLLGNTLVNTGVSIIAARILYRMFNSTNAAIITGIMTYILLVVGEFCPKFYSIGNAERISSKSIPIINFIRYIFLPLTIPINALMRIIAPTPLLSKLITREELRVLVECQAEDGSVTEREKDFILRLLELKDKKVGDIMTGVDKVFAIELGMDIKFDAHTYSRIPVYKKDINHIIGMLYVKDLLTQPTPYKIRKLLRRPYFVWDSMSAAELFSRFQKTGVHIAIVVDKHKTIKGVVTLDDILNTIIGKK